MKKILVCALALVVLAASAIGEIVTDEILPELTVEPTPASVEASADIITAGTLFTAKLPAGYRMLAGEEAEGYEAAVSNLYPGSGETLFALVNADRTGAICASDAESGLSGMEAAQDAAAAVLGAASYASECTYNNVSGGTFACSVGGRRYDFYFFDIGGKTVTISTAGADGDTVADFLNSISLIG